MFRLVLEVVLQWFEVKDLVFLDSAYCSRKERSAWMELILQSPQCVLSCSASNEQNCPFFDWIYQRQIRVDGLKITNDKDLLAGMKQAVRFGKFVKSVHFHKMNITQTGSAEDVIALASHCNKLASLKCAMCTIDTSVFEILYGCKSLETLQLVGCENRYCVGFTEPCSIELAAWWQTSKLHSVVMDGAQISNILASAFLRSLPPSHLKRLIVSWQSESVMQSTLQKLTECGHNIKSLGFARSCRLRDNHWRTMTELCPAVLHLDFSMCSSAITDASCEIIVRNLTQLRTLNVSYCDITEFGLLSLAEHSSDTLEALISFGCDNIAGWGYNTILARCHKLHTLALTTYTSTLDQLELPLLHNLTTFNCMKLNRTNFIFSNTAHA